MVRKSANARHPMTANVGVWNFLSHNTLRTVQKLPTRPRPPITSIITGTALEISEGKLSKVKNRRGNLV
jgi:hypothetical protein